MQANEDELQKTLIDFSGEQPGAVDSAPAETAGATPEVTLPAEAAPATTPAAEAPDPSAMTEAIVSGATATPEVSKIPENPPVPEITPIETSEVTADFSAIEDEILNDLIPLLDKVDAEPEKKFAIYLDAFEKKHDAELIKNAYEIVGKFTDEEKKGEALLKLFDKIEEVKQ